MGADEAIAFARAQLGKPYKFGATGPDSYDCSGLCQAAWKAGGVHIDRVTEQQIFDGSEVTRDQLQPGDLLFPDPGHVQLYVGSNHVIEAPHTGAFVRDTQVWGFWRARRVGPPGSTSVTNVIPAVDLNPLDLLNRFPVLGELEKIGAALSSAAFWKRIGVATLGVFLLLVGIAFINRQKIAAQAKSTLEGGKQAAELAALA